MPFDYSSCYYFSFSALLVSFLFHFIIVFRIVSITLYHRLKNFQLNKQLSPMNNCFKCFKCNYFIALKLLAIKVSNKMFPLPLYHFHHTPFIFPSTSLFSLLHNISKSNITCTILIVICIRRFLPLLATSLTHHLHSCLSSFHTYTT